MLAKILVGVCSSRSLKPQYMYAIPTSSPGILLVIWSITLELDLGLVGPDDRHHNYVRHNAFADTSYVSHSRKCFVYQSQPRQGLYVYRDRITRSWALEPTPGIPPSRRTIPLYLDVSFSACLCAFPRGPLRKASVVRWRGRPLR